MFGLPEALMSFIRRQVGLRTDAASSTGSLHAKVKYLIDTSIAGILSAVQQRQTPRGVVAAAGSYSTGATSYGTALNITGKGALKAIAVKGAGSYHATVKITIDGVVINELNSQDSTYLQYPVANNSLNWLLNIGGANSYGFDVIANDGNPQIFTLEFNTSLKIELKAEDINDTVYVYWFYEKEAA